MKAMTRNALRRGFSLVELMVSVVIMAVAIAATLSVVLSLSTMTHNAELYGDDDDRARMAATHMQRAIEGIGLFTPAGIWVNGGATTPTLISPVFGHDGTTGGGQATGGSLTVTADKTDDLWMVVPDRNAFREGCVDTGAAVSVTKTQAGGTGALVTQCLGAITTFATTDTLVAANSTTGALLSPPLVFATSGANGTIGFAEQAVGNFAPAPTPGVGFGVSDVVYRVQVYHYSIKVNPQTGRPGLCRHLGIVGLETGALAALKRPFLEDPAQGDDFVMDYIEDMQVKYLFDNPAAPGDPAQYTVADSMPPNFNTATPLRSVRVSLVGVGLRRDHDTSGGNGVALGPLPVENNTVVGPNDGFRRTLYVQRLELPNIAPGNL
jgi:prepilin-type N-terminal cleavage/methylation domain-containing protein